MIKITRAAFQLLIYIIMVVITSEKPHTSDFLEITYIYTYFDVLNMNMIIKIGENDIFKVERTEKPRFSTVFRDYY